MNPVLRHLLRRSILRAAQMHTLLWSIALLAQLNYLFSRGAPVLAVNPIKALLVGLITVLPLTLPLAATWGTSAALFDWNKHGEEEAFACAGGSPMRVRLWLVLPITLFALASGILQWHGLAKTNYWARDASHLKPIELVKLVSSGRIPVNGRVNLQASVGETGSLQNLRMIFRDSPSGSQSHTAISAQNARFHAGKGQTMGMELDHGWLHQGFLPENCPAMSFEHFNLNFSNSILGLRDANTWHESNRTLRQIIAERDHFPIDSKKWLTLRWEPWYRLVICLLPLILSLQIILSVPVGIAARRLSNYIFLSAVLTTTLGMGLVLATRSAARHSVLLLSVELFAALLLPPLLCRMMANHADS
ncbi:MAG: LptF/LptG family permease [Planctomycetes bacterium]|nr:LptF/LptG family permease [Planctomycetota bacterium]